MNLFGRKITKTTICMFMWFISGTITTVLFFIGKLSDSQFQNALIAISAFWGMAGLKVAGDKTTEEV